MRRNAVLAINAIYKLPKGEVHLQDAPELIEKVLTSEQDLSTKRNAFQMLCNHAQDRAVHYLLSQIDNVAHWGDILQMAVLDLIRKVGSCSALYLFQGCSCSPGMCILCRCMARCCCTPADVVMALSAVTAVKHAPLSHGLLECHCLGTGTIEADTISGLIPVKDVGCM